MTTRLTIDSDHEIYIYINEEDPNLNWNWKKYDFQDNYLLHIEEIYYLCTSMFLFFIFYCVVFIIKF
jgi:hypothetical protein